MNHYNTVRLHSAIGFVTPADMLAGGAEGDPRRTGPQTGGGPPPATTAPAATSSMRQEVTMAMLGETEAGSAGMQPCRGMPGGLIETMTGAQRPRFRAPQKSTSDR